MSSRSGMAAALAAALGFAVPSVLPAAPAAADSFTPVRLTIPIAPVARRDAPLAVTVGVSADPAVLDGSAGPLRIGVKLASECGGTFQTTPGTTLLNAALSPQPATGRAYSGTARGSGRPTTYGSRPVCADLQDTAVGRVYASDQSDQVTVSQPCTTAAGRYDAAARSLVRSQRRLGHTVRVGQRRRLMKTIAARRRTAGRDRTPARAACGPGVPL